MSLLILTYAAMPFHRGLAAPDAGKATTGVRGSGAACRVAADAGVKCKSAVRAQKFAAYSCWLVVYLFFILLDIFSIIDLTSL